MVKKLQYLCLLIGIILSIFLSFHANKNPQGLIWSDMEGYYIYLPSVFIYGGFKKEAVRDTNYIKPFQNSEKILTKYTSGVAILEAPFFLLSHILSKPFGFASDGHSLIYCYGLMISAIFYFWMALWLLLILGRRYYKPQIVILALVGLVFGTNLYYYTFFQPAMSHIYSFFLFSAFILLTDNILIQKYFFRKSTLLTWAIYGIVIGMIILVRPTNFIVALIPIYIISKNQPFLTFITKNRKEVILSALMVFLVMAPQLLYWKYISDSWILWSYEEENFRYWKEPKLFRVLFDAWNGWILYSPIVIFPLYFLFKNRKTNQHYERVYIYIFAIATYTFASWWAWWFGGAFGHRSYVEYLSFLLLPFCGFMERINTKKPIAQYSFLVLFLLFCYYSTGLTYQYSAPWDGQSWTYKSVLMEVEKLFFLRQ